VQNKLTKKQSRLLPVPTITNGSAFDLQLSIKQKAEAYQRDKRFKQASAFKIFKYLRIL